MWKRVLGLFMACFSLSLLLASSCTISNPYKRPIFIPEHINTVYVFTFPNNTKFPGLQETVRRYLEMEVSRNSMIALTRDLRFADAVLQGEIKSLFIQEIDRTPSGQIDRARYCLVLDFSLKDVAKNTYLMTNQEISLVRKIQLYSQPVTDLPMIRLEMVSNISWNIIRYATAGERDDFNKMYGFEDKPLIDDDGTLIGKPPANYDTNNDGIDDRLQGITNTTASNQ